MEKNNLPGLTPLWIVLLATVLGVFLPIATVGRTDSIKASDWIGFAGSVLTAGVAAAAIYYAWRGIVRNLRVTLISREEDRMEAALPGLRDVVNLADQLSSDLADGSPEKILRALDEKSVYTVGGRTISKSIKSRLSRTDDRTYRRFYGQFVALRKCAAEVKAAEMGLAEASKLRALNAGGSYEEGCNDRYEAALQVGALAQIDLDDALAEFSSLINQLNKQIALYERRLPIFRSEIEAYFDER